MVTPPIQKIRTSDLLDVDEMAIVISGADSNYGHAIKNLIAGSERLGTTATLQIRFVYTSILQIL